jgi:hypothetical protein
MYFIEASHYDIQTTKRSLLLPPCPNAYLLLRRVRADPLTSARVLGRQNGTLGRQPS